MNIGFFDSGLGGLTILKTVVAKLPQYDYSYYGDTANLPYGDKSEEEIYQLTTAGMKHLFDNGSALVIIACNTASAETARRLQTEFLPTKYSDRKVLGIIIPTIEVLQFSKPTRVLLIGTKRTVESSKYTNELNLKKIKNVILTEVATPELAPLIEANNLNEAGDKAIQYIEAALGENEVILLACTHYTQIKNILRKHFANKIKIISQDEVIPDKLDAYLTNHPEIVAKLTKKGERNIYLTKHRHDYDEIMGHFLGGVLVG